ncbi:unnamed protein product [marine sediment metagenome]|uniref:Uncharacterized protein n=1 Tax=marine sediment metagenome TaxID=412755 RepID=X1AXL1_9ZZZZ
MSADNFIAIRKEGRKYVGYDQSIYADEQCYDYPVFKATSIKEAIRLAQAEHTEYGYVFVNLEDK